MRLTQAKTSVLLSVLFLAVYASCNWITAIRSDVGFWFFEWERRTPFVAFMILPYVSLDFFFIAAPFLLQSELERQVFAQRITAAILIAAAFFVLLPLQFGFPRPVVSGWLGTFYRTLHAFDQPFNLFPSLHITLQILVADTYTRHTKGVTRWVIQLWFSLTCLSTLLTYQHHIIDIAGGIILATFCFYFIREFSLTVPVVKTLRISLYYAFACTVILTLSICVGPWGYLLLWPAFSSGAAAAAYMGLGASIYRKQDGRLPVSAKIILAPLLLGQYLSLLYYQRRCRPWDEVVPGVWIGRKLSRAEANDAVKLGITAVLDLTAEFSEASPFLAGNYLNLPVLDLTAPDATQLQAAAAYIEQHSVQGKVYVHCKIGYSRSAAAVGAYLLKTGRVKTTEEAVSLIRQGRPSLIVRSEILDVLRKFHRGLQSGSDNSPRSITALELGRDNRNNRLAGRFRRRSETIRFPTWSLRPTTHFLRSTIQRFAVFPLHNLWCRPFEVHGRKNLENLQLPALFIANHTSHVDTLSIVRALPGRMRRKLAVAAAADYFFCNRAMSTATPLLLNTFPFARNGAIRASLEYCGELVEGGWSILIYPEGTRSTTGYLQPFKNGIGVLATNLQIPVVPIGVEGGFHILPKGHSLPSRGPVKVRFGPPITVSRAADTRTAVALLQHAVADLIRREDSLPATLATRQWHHLPVPLNGEPA